MSESKKANKSEEPKKAANKSAFGLVDGSIQPKLERQLGGGLVLADDDLGDVADLVREFAEEMGAARSAAMVPES